MRRLSLSQARLSAALLARFVRDNSAFPVFARRGFQLLRNHYYLPIPEQEDLTPAHWAYQSDLPGVDLNLDGSWHYFTEHLRCYTDEFRRCLPLEDDDGTGRFHLYNYAFMAVDAHVYWAFVRRMRPKRIYEIGSGFCTQVAAEAAKLNAAEGSPCSITAIDPYPSKRLRSLADIELIAQRVQEVDITRFQRLEAGDILFIDSTHVLREGGDVWWEYCEILPRLGSGVLVHVHDVSLPRSYPKVYFERDHYYWNEQYVLQAFLAFNNRFRVLWPGNALLISRPDEMLATFPELRKMRQRYPDSEPVSFWMEVA